ncbi:MAG: poly-beta-1,6 N-acetyl-D-glucosamine synthase [Gemmatimonadetes bacterium]|nr:poly-beta-1,6 N-acetyl-D-glucosamine synthase [Gemmatimonadota bacterium]
MLRDVLAAVDSSPLYHAGLIFYGMYPVSMAIIWIILSIVYFRRREVDPEKLAPSDFTPFVSVLLPAFEEQNTIHRTLDALLRLDYPSYEIVVVNDGSGDNTAEVVRSYLHTGRVRLVDKEVNEGKAMALNDAVPVCGGEIIVCLDSDVVPDPSLLRKMIPHFLSPRVGAVTGNPRVVNRGSLLRDLQTLEFTSIISVQRRAQRIWGRVLTVSGAVMAMRKTAMQDVGGFAPSMATEDIDITWKLQRTFWDVRYEPAAIVWMHVPPTLGELWKQRRRWARGLAQVLRAHASCVLNWKQRRLWPVFAEAVLSIMWAYTFLLITTYWIISAIVGHAPLGASPIPNVWGMIIATACLTQLLAGAIMDRHYDRDLMRYFPVAIFYPLIYWMLMSLITAIYTFDGLLRRRPEVQRWKIRRA